MESKEFTFKFIAIENLNFASNNKIFYLKNKTLVYKSA